MRPKIGDTIRIGSSDHVGFSWYDSGLTSAYNEKTMRYNINTGKYYMSQSGRITYEWVPAILTERIEDVIKFKIGDTARHRRSKRQDAKFVVSINNYEHMVVDGQGKIGKIILSKHYYYSEFLSCRALLMEKS